jgi:ATP/maltotriose-dependent transcriptional regulator MalT
MTDGWVAYCRLQLERNPVLIQQCEAAVGDRTLETEQAGELEFFRGSIAYWTGEAENSRRHLEEALSRLGSKERYVESETELALGLARCMTGDKELAVTALEDRIRGTAKQKGVYLAKLIGALVLIHLLSGDLAYALAAVKRFRRVAAMNRLQNHRAWSDYFEGCAHLQTNEFVMASHHFSRALERRYILEIRAVLDALKDVLGLAEAGGWIRPFVESGAPLADLLKELRKQDVTVDYINRILAAFPEPESKPPLPDLGATNDDREFEAEALTPIEKPKSKIQNSLIEPLTNRELDVLELLAQRLQNNEIAEKLVISPATVKSHLESIYQKLNVSKRREAVDKANALKIFTRR